MTLGQIYEAHVADLKARAAGGESEAVLSLACIAIAAGCPGPNPDGPGGEPLLPPDNVLDFQQYRRAA